MQGSAVGRRRNVPSGRINSSIELFDTRVACASRKMAAMIDLTNREVPNEE
jgi:hypothetical protein